MPGPPRRAGFIGTRPSISRHFRFRTLSLPSPSSVANLISARSSTFCSRSSGPALRVGGWIAATRRYFLIACSALSIASMQPTKKAARSRFITFSLPAFSLQNICRAISACRFCAASLYSGLIPEIALSSEKAKVEGNTAIKTRKLTRLKLLLLFLSLQPPLYKPAENQ